jgi:hypothetical protein
MRFILTLLLVLGVASTALAGPQSTIGATGWPSTSYEWWNKGSGKLDWALGGELVYGPWSGAWDDPRIAFAASTFGTASGPRPEPTWAFGSRPVSWRGRLPSTPRWSWPGWSSRFQ